MPSPTNFVAAFEIALARAGRTPDTMTPMDYYVGNVADNADRAARRSADEAEALARELTAYADGLRGGTVPRTLPLESSRPAYLRQLSADAAWFSQQLGELFPIVFGITLAKACGEAKALGRGVLEAG